MSKGFTYRRRVQFAETDLAGIAHFSSFFRFMEEAEHALWRAAGLSIGAAEETGGWPRVAAAFTFRESITASRPHSKLFLFDSTAAPFNSIERTIAVAEIGSRPFWYA